MAPPPSRRRSLELGRLASTARLAALDLGRDVVQMPHSGPGGDDVALRPGQRRVQEQRVDPGGCRLAGVGKRGVQPVVGLLVQAADDPVHLEVAADLQRRAEALAVAHGIAE